MGSEVDLMWETFDNLTLMEYTVRRIRVEMFKVGYDLSEFKDSFLIQRMIRVLRSAVVTT